MRKSKKEMERANCLPNGKYNSVKDAKLLQYEAIAASLSEAMAIYKQ